MSRTEFKDDIPATKKLDELYTLVDGALFEVVKGIVTGSEPDVADVRRISGREVERLVPS